MQLPGEITLLPRHTREALAGRLTPEQFEAEQALAAKVKQFKTRARRPSATDEVRQGDLANLFSRSQAWVCNQQRLKVDPMPGNLAGALAWARARGFAAGWTSDFRLVSKVAVKA